MDENWEVNVLNIKGSSQMQIGRNNKMCVKSKRTKPSPSKEELSFPAESEELRKVRTSTRVVSHRELTKIAHQSGLGWRHLLRYLDIEDEKIDQARQDGIGIPETVYQLLLQWKQDTGEKATVSKMFRAMEKSNLKKLWTCLKQDSGDEEL